MNKKYRENVDHLIKFFAQKVSPHETIKIKMNGNKVQSDFEEDRNLCSIYSILFVQNQLDGLSFAQSTNFDQNEKQQILEQTSEAEKNGVFDMI